MQLDADFEEQAKQALLDDVHRKASGIEGIMMLIAETNWRAYADANGYDIDHIWRDAESEVHREDDAVRIEAEWPGSGQFEWGVDPHVIEATSADVLAFPWPEMAGVEFGNTGQTFDEVFAETWPVVFFPEVNWGSETGGIPEARAIRDMLHEMRGELR